MRFYDIIPLLIMHDVSEQVLKMKAYAPSTILEFLEWYEEFNTK